jgi:two-component system cell cycle sensor histidine kinase/response regulator CckA
MLSDDGFFRSVVEQFDQGVLVLDRSNAVVFHNAAALALLGPALLPDYPDALPDELVVAGTRLRVRTWPLTSGNGDLRGRVVMVCGPSPESPAREESTSGQSVIDSIVENIPDMVFLKTAEDLRFERFNRAGEELLGIPRETLIGKTDFDFFPKAQAEFFQKRDRETLEGGRLVDITEEPIDTAQGRRWLHTKKIPILDERGAPKYLLGISSDITARRAAEEALKQAHDELEERVAQRTEELRRAEHQLRHAQKLEAVGRLAGGVAHDFNNVLAVILGHVGLMEQVLAEDARARTGLDPIRVAAEHAAALTRQLLAFSRKQVMETRVLNLNRVVEQARGMLGRLLGEDITLVTRLAPSLGNVRADPALVEQVIVSLSVNARDAMPTGGELVIETCNLTMTGQSPEEPTELGPGNYVKLRVTDTGVGMDADTRGRIFEPFFTTKATGQGTGLGLSMAYGVVTQSGGSIAVESEPGRGTSFSVFLPTTRELRTETPAPLQTTMIRGNGETILVAEDEPPLRRVIKSILERAGYVVIDAESGEDALQLSSEHSGRIDLLLSDVVMPAIDGPELARRLLVERPTMRVLFMSGYTDERLSSHRVNRAFSELLPKPFTAEALTVRVRAVLDGTMAVV